MNWAQFIILIVALVFIGGTIQKLHGMLFDWKSEWEEKNILENDLDEDIVP